MTELFDVNGAHAAPVPTTTLPAEGLEERAHLQEWVLAHPGVLGEDVMVITSEYDRWRGEDGTTAKDRLDILGLESTGRLVVVELKRADAGRDVHLQAITYAALVSRFDLDTLAQAHARYTQTRPGPTLSVEGARQAITDHVAGELDPAVLATPRLLLIAASFPRTVTHTCVWLSEMGVDIDLISVTTWKLANGQVRAGFTKVYPTPETAEFTLAPARAEQAAVARKVAERNRAATAVRRLVDAGALPEGTVLTLRPDHGASQASREAIAAWVGEDPTRGTAVWTNDPAKPLKWHGKAWSPSRLAQEILQEVTGLEASIRGTTWWVTPEGVDLAALADSLVEDEAPVVPPADATEEAEPVGDADLVHPQDGQATIVWTPPASDGGSPVTGYTITASPGGRILAAPADAREATMTGLVNGTTYTFTVTASNVVGAGPATATNPVTPRQAATAPQPPQAVVATPGAGTATVTWAAPADDGGSSITGYTVTSSPGGKSTTVSATARSAVVTGLSNGTAYTFAVVARNAVGTSTSSTSSPVTPRAVPTAPATAAATPGNGQATITWAAPVSDGGSPVTGYTITASPGGKTVTAGPAARTTTVTGLSNGTSFRAACQGGSRACVISRARMLCSVGVGDERSEVGRRELRSGRRKVGRLIRRRQGGKLSCAP